MTEKRRLGLFLGSKHFGLKVFRTLHGADRDTEWRVLCPDDRGDPRSALDEFCAFAKAAALDIKIARTRTEANAMITDLAPAALFACGWYWLLSGEHLDKVPLGCFGVHNSLLPKYRGWAPLVWSIINGDREVGVSVFKFSTGVDDGDLLLQVPVPLDDHETIAIALEKIEAALQQRLPYAWLRYLDQRVQLMPQDHRKATYCGRRIEADGHINWTETAQTLHNFIRAQSPPYPGAFSFDESGQKIVFLKACVDPRTYFGTTGQILEVSSDHVVVACGGATALQVTSVAVNGRKLAPRSVIKSTTMRLL